MIIVFMYNKNKFKPKDSTCKKNPPKIYMYRSIGVCHLHVHSLQCVTFIKCQSMVSQKPTKVIPRVALLDNKTYHLLV